MIIQMNSENHKMNASSALPENTEEEMINSFTDSHGLGIVYGSDEYKQLTPLMKLLLFPALDLLLKTDIKFPAPEIDVVQPADPSTNT